MHEEHDDTLDPCVDGVANNAGERRTIDEGHEDEAPPEASQFEATTVQLVDGNPIPVTSHRPRNGRPCHPVWKHFVRGEKRNRFHYRAYCRFCVDAVTALHRSNGGTIDDPLELVTPTRGVPADMLKHLHQCPQCPSAVLEHLHRNKKRTSPASASKRLPTSSSTMNLLHPKPPRPMPSDAEQLALEETSRRQHVATWKATVSAGLDLRWTQSVSAMASLTLPPLHLKDMVGVARDLARTQLVKVKEGMLNSTIKGGLTLSLNTWTTRRQQHMVAFSLLKSDGEACAVSVVETAWTRDAIEHHIRSVLKALHADDVCIVGIVAEGMLALKAAEHVRATSHPELLVVPCVAQLLSTIAGSILTSTSDVIATVGCAIELLAWCRQPPPHVAQLLPSFQSNGEPLPNRQNAGSFYTCLKASLALKPGFIRADTRATLQSYLPPPLWSQVSTSEFWSNVLRVAEALEPLADAIKLLRHPTASRTLSHVTYAFARIFQAYAASMSTELLCNETCSTLTLLDRMWTLYEQPAMVLATYFDFHLNSTWLATTDADVAAAFAAYSTRWFHQPVAVSRIQDILHAVRSKTFPFDCTPDYHDVSSFYSFVANSHPELCALCCRLYAISIVSAPVHAVLRGIGFDLSHTATMHDANMVLPLLHIGLTTAMSRGGKGRACDGFVQPDVRRWLDANENQSQLLYSESEWRVVATQWQAHIRAEVGDLPPINCRTKQQGLQHLFAPNLPRVSFDC
ncbi:hypothetical protein DYB32_004984 [Aphanomyces invadans]|uniref:BED-type domain-containing protein n=1 Tax=Aphanomyces invadans TaxID=157072 RepID=A0A418AVZ3_9STRA|nr:hypothetical protein DYB32_004984 [Aphanomyces invadans]